MVIKSNSIEKRLHYITAVIYAAIKINRNAQCCFLRTHSLSMKFTQCVKEKSSIEHRRYNGQVNRSSQL